MMMKSGKDLIDRLDKIEKSDGVLEHAPDSNMIGRNKYIKKIKREILVDYKLLEPKLFIGFNGGEKGRAYAQEAATEFRKLPVPYHLIQDRKFGIETGMKVEAGDKEGMRKVTDHILHLLNSCCIFIGILSDEYELKSGMNVPGPWSFVEAGMALYQRMPVILITEKSIDEQYWKKVFTDTRHASFSRGKFSGCFPFAKTLIIEAYDELCLKA
jgi:hypothetical protein